MATERARGNHDDGRACKLCGGHGYGGETCPHCGRQPTAEQVMDARRCEDPHALLAQCKAAEREAATLREALADLVRLKDGPRDDAYRAEKDAAWDRARAALAGAGRST